MNSTQNLAFDYYRELSFSLDPNQILNWTINRFNNDKITVGTGFGAPGIVLLDIINKISPNIDVFYVDPGYLFKETYELKIKLEDYFNKQFIRVNPNVSEEQQEIQYGKNLWEENPHLCCEIRKVEPLSQALKNKDVWITGIRKSQTKMRKNSDIIEFDNRFSVVKVNPLINWSHDKVWEYIRKNELPYNDLHDKGYPSLGCVQCTTSVKKGEDDRSGRWRGKVKTECGIHYPNEIQNLNVIQNGGSNG